MLGDQHIGVVRDSAVRLRCFTIRAVAVRAGVDPDAAREEIRTDRLWHMAVACRVSASFPRPWKTR